METLLHSDSSRLYSWWWDSHISPRNSKWLQENLTGHSSRTRLPRLHRVWGGAGSLRNLMYAALPYTLYMDTKVKSMIKLIEEDADSFARRAEMYYEKRPELLKMVEQFYRAYRALAERYDHMTGELRQAHCTIAQAFPNHLNHAANEDSPSISSAPDTGSHTPDVDQQSEEAELAKHNELISELENMVSHVEENIEGLTITGLEAENEAGYLSHEITRLESEGKDGSLNYNLCLEKISYLDEHLGRNQVEAMPQNLPSDHFRAHEALVLELKTQIQMLQRSEQCKSELEDEILRVKDENQKLHDEKTISTLSIDSLQNQILDLRKMKEILEEEAAEQTVKTNSLQTEILSLRQELEALSKRYQLSVQKLESEDIDNDMVGSSTKNSQNHETESVKKVVISEKLQDMEELSKRKILQESSLQEFHGELEASREEVRELRYTSQFLRGANSVLNSEKTTLQAQLETLTENMHVVLERNAVLENSLLGAKIELEGQKEKSKGLEEICGLLKNEKSDLLAQRDTLLVQLAHADGRSERLEKRLVWLEEMYANLRKENKNVQFQVEELALSLNSVKHERINSTCRYETRLVSVEHHIHLLEEESRWRKQVCEDELAKAAIAQFELFIVKKFLEDAVDKHYALLTEREKHVEASKLAEKLIDELRNQNLEQQIEAENLLDEIERLRFGLYRVFKAFEADSNKACEGKIASEQTLVNEIVGNIDHIRQSITQYKDDSELLKIENLVLLTLIQQMQIEDAEIETKKELVELELSFTTEKLEKLQNVNYRLVQMNDSLKSELNKGKQEITLRQVGMEILCVKQDEMEKAYMHLQENYFSMLDEIKYLHKKCSNHEEENCKLKSENEDFQQDIFALVTVTTVLESFAYEEHFELETLHQELYKMTGIKAELANDINALRGKLEMKEEQNIFLKDLVQRYEMELLDLKDVLSQREFDLLEAEEKLKGEEGMNLELSKTLVEQKTEFKETLLEKETLENQVLKLSEVKKIQQKEIEDLLDMNANLMSELCKLHEVCEEHRIKEQNLHAELKAEFYGYELLNYEATELYADLQISSIQEVIYENVVRDLTELCGNLEGEAFSRTLKIHELKEKISLIDGEMGKLRAELLRYPPAIASVGDAVASLEHNILLKLKLQVPDALETKYAEAFMDTSIHCQDEPVDDQIFTSTGIEILQNLQSRIRAVEKTFVEEITKLVMRQNLNAKGSRETARNETSEIIVEVGLAHGELRGKGGTGIDPKNSMKFKNVKPEASSLRKGTTIKDDPLDPVLDPLSYRWCKKANISIERADDKMLELWEAAENSGHKQGSHVRRKPSSFAARKRTLLSDQIENTGWKIEHQPSSMSFEAEKKLTIDELEFPTNLTESTQEVKNQKIHDRIASNARKLNSLELIVQNLNRRLEANKKNCKSKNMDLEMVEQQLLQVQGSVLQLVDFNGRLIRSIEENSSSSGCQFSGEQEEGASLKRKKASEQALTGSGKIGQLQLEVQKLENMLTKLENRRKSKGRSRLSRNGTTVILRDVIYDEKNIGKRKKAHLCGCFRPASNGKPRKM